MSKTFTKEDVILNKKEAIKSLNKLLEYYINDSTGNHLKKANLISYWLKDFVQYIQFEEKFDPVKNIAYKRGNIVKVNFGFNVGSEYGGLHYAIVLDNHNSHNSPVITLIPLTSIKDAKIVHPNNVELGNELYRSLKLKYDTISKSLKDEKIEISRTLDTFDKFLSIIKEISDELQYSDEYSDENSEEYERKIADAVNYIHHAKELQLIWQEKSRHNSEEQEYLDKIGKEIAQMKEGSIALVNQITTVSKMRIFDPKTAKGVLSGISLSKEGMQKINDKMKELYIFN